VGQLLALDGSALTIDGLWGLTVGNDDLLLAVGLGAGLLQRRLRR
jgi:hypothetical protein